MDKEIRKVKSLKGEIRVPSDKSISHRAIILSALAEGTSIVKNFLEAGDTLTTVDVYKKLGVKIHKEKDLYFIDGIGIGNIKEPDDILYMGNSGTTTRLTLGVLAGHKIFATLTGDNSLRKRPMKRVLSPLKMMGANVDGRNKGEFLPVAIRGGNLRGIEYFNERASAQVKSALLLAGLSTTKRTTVIEPIMSRDHTERMLKSMGANIKTEYDEGGYRVHIYGGNSLKAIDIDVPADPSSAAFFVAGAILVPDSKVVLKEVLINPTRDGFFRKLKQMGAKIEYINQREQAGEPVADIVAEYTPQLKPVEVEKIEVPSMIDELPLLALVATQAEGETIIKGAKELRVKESDRIKTVVENLKNIGINVEELDDGMIIKGKQVIKGGIVDSFDDHRIAMGFSILGLISENPIKIKNAKCAEISYPQFFDHLESLIKY